MDSVELQSIIFVISEAIDFAGVIIIALGAVIGVIVTVLAIIVLVRTVSV